MVWNCTKGSWIYWTEDIKDGVSRQEKKRKTSEEGHGCSDRIHAEGWCDDKGGCWGEMETDDP